MLVLEDAAAERWGWVLVVYLLALLGVAIPPVKPFTPLLPATAALLLACAAIALRDRRADSSSPAEAAELRKAGPASLRAS